MATTEKERYPKVLVEAMVTAYTGAKTEKDRANVVNTFAESTGYGVFAIRGKLSREDVYIAKVRTGKDGKTPSVRKEVLVAELVKLTGINAVTMETMEKANKIALQSLVDFIEPLVNKLEELED